jgi:hypothetical protein
MKQNIQMTEEEINVICKLLISSGKEQMAEGIAKQAGLPMSWFELGGGWLE